MDIPTTLDRSQGDVHSAGNPHFMMDPVDARVVAGHIAETLCTIDAASCPVFKANLAAFQAKLDARMQVWQTALAPFKGTTIVTYHPTWKYFAARFGLVSELYLEPKPGIPPSPPHLAEVIQKMNADHIRVILVEPFQSRKTAEAVADRTGATVVDVCQFPGGLPGTAGDYIALMDADVKAIVAGLSAKK
jgi:ABC-type Zn uptake system ZnuABC Zn-binding protein ZnuA